MMITCNNKDKSRSAEEVKILKNQILKLEHRECEYKQKIKEMENSQTGMHAIFDQINGIAVYEAVDGGQNFIFKDLNRVGEKMDRVRREDIIGKNITDVFPGVHEFGLFAALQKAWVSGESQYLPESLYKDEKEPGRWRENWIFKIPSNELVAVYKDTSSQRVAEDALEKSEALYKELVEEAGVAVLIDDNEGNIVYSSKKIIELFGYTEKELRILPIQSLIHPEDAEKMMQLHQKRRRGENVPSRYEFKGLKKDGTSLNLELFAVALKEAGKIIGVLVYLWDISERIKTDMELRESEERYRLLFNNASLGISYFDLTGKVISFNSRAIALLGLKQKNYIDKSLHELFSPAQANEYKRRLLKSARTKSSLIYEDQVSLPDGLRWFLSTLNRIKNAEGAVIGVQMISTDISEQKKLEHQLAAEKNMLRTLIDNLPDYIYFKDSRSRYLFNNTAHMLQTGATSQTEIIGKADHDFFPKDLAEKYQADEQHLINTGEPLIDSEEYTLDKSGNNQYLRTTKVPIFDKNKKIIGLVGIGRDITKQKKTEDALRESQRQINTLIGNLPGLVYRCKYKPSWKMEFVSNGSIQLTGHHPDYFCGGRGKSFSSIVHPSDRQFIGEEVQRALKKKKIFQLTYRIKTANNRVKWVLERGQGIFGLNDEVVALEGFITDITASKRTEQKLKKYQENLEDRVRERTQKLEKITREIKKSRQSLIYLVEDVNESRQELKIMNDRLLDEVLERKSKEKEIKESTLRMKHINEELETFSYSVSHDLRAPLRHMSGFLGLLENHTQNSLDKKSRHYFSMINEASKKMELLIEGLLSFSRMGRSDLKKVNLNTKSILNQVIQELEPDTNGKKIQWNIGAVPDLYADKLLLQQALTNLLSNAIKFSRNCQTAKIEVGSMPDQSGKIIFYVRDNGVGFNPQYKDKLFGVFQRLHNSEQFEGTGIGLANVRRIITRHGGEIWAESAVGKGATFYFSLPGA